MLEFVKILIQGRVSEMEREERGATAVEYGLLVALIAAVIVGIVAILGGQILDAFTAVSDELDGATP